MLGYVCGAGVADPTSQVPNATGLLLLNTRPEWSRACSVQTPRPLDCWLRCHLVALTPGTRALVSSGPEVTRDASTHTVGQKASRRPPGFQRAGKHG